MLNKKGVKAQVAFTPFSAAILLSLGQQTLILLNV